MRPSSGITCRSTTHCEPANSGPIANGIASSAKRTGHGSPGMACREFASSGPATWPISPVRGRKVSEPASSSWEATSEISGPPNIDSAVSTGDPVAS